MASAEELGVDDVEEVLTSLYSLQRDTTTARSEFRTLCPVHEAGETGHRPSCDINLETGYWNCFSCPAQGDLVDLGCVVLENLPYALRDAKEKTADRKTWMRGRATIRKLLQPDDPDAIRSAIQRRTRTARKAVMAGERTRDRFQAIVPPVDAYGFRYHPFLKARGFDKKTLRRFDVRFVEEATLLKEDGKSFTIDNAIGIPIFDAKKILLGWCYRATEDSASWFQNVRYIYTPGLQDILNFHWFGMHMVTEWDEITVVEGALDALWLWQHGIPAVAVLGSQVKQVQKVRALMEFRKVTLFFDRDLSGATTTHYLGEALQDRGVPCTVCRYSSWMLNRKGMQAGDVQDLAGLDLELVHARSVPYVLWRRGNRQSAA